MFSFFTILLDILPLYCNKNFCFSVFFCYLTSAPALYPFLGFFRSQLVNCFLENFPCSMPRILIRFPNFFIVDQCVMECIPIASASEKTVYCSLYYAFSDVEG